VGFVLQPKGFELIKGDHLDTVPFHMERDLITPSYKKKRRQLLKYYQVKLSLLWFDESNYLSLQICFLCFYVFREKLMKCITKARK